MESPLIILWQRYNILSSNWCAFLIINFSFSFLYFISITIFLYFWYFWAKFYLSSLSLLTIDLYYFKFSSSYEVFVRLCITQSWIPSIVRSSSILGTPASFASFYNLLNLVDLLNSYPWICLTAFYSMDS